MKRLLAPPWAAGIVGLGAVAVIGAVALVAPERETVRAGHPPELVAFDSCDSALDGLRSAARDSVGPYGFGGPTYALEYGAGNAEARAAVPNAAAAEPQAHSGTNNHEAGVEEPDLVQTDGRRVVSAADGTLRVVDVASRTITATVPLPGGPATQLLLHGDRALVVSPGGVPAGSAGFAPSGFGSQLTLVGLTGQPHVLGTLSLDGQYVDARQVDGKARVVVRSAPRLPFTQPQGGPAAEPAALRANLDVLERSTIDQWLPRYELVTGQTRQQGRLVDCADVSHPETYQGTGMLTVLTIDLAGTLGTGDPVSIVADGDTVYGTATSLYVAASSTPAWPAGRRPMAVPGPAPPQRTELHQFDITAPGQPRHVASGSVEGGLLNQYSLSEHEGHLRVATTTQRADTSSSAVTVLVRKGNELVQTGRVGGLGEGERIYAVRFVGPVGYVVTFRETDPLYTLDLRDPAAPRTVGELKITGYSAYLHGAGEGRLIGVGQEADQRGRVRGLQVSLFDVSAPERPDRIAQHHVADAHSEVEADPHAFLYWPPTGLVVLPMSTPSAQGGALVLRLGDRGFTEVGRVQHPASPAGDPGDVRRAMVIGGELWTVSGAGVLVSDTAGLSRLAWVPFS